MNNFVYHNTTKLIFGKDTEKNVGNEIGQLYKKVLLHYGGGSIKKSGLYSSVIKSLEENGIEFVELSGVVPNPELDLVYEGIELCRKNDVEFILAIGGGSVIDSAKAIAAGVLYSGDVWDFFIGKGDPKEALPVGVILTIPAAGSENSISCVISKPDENIKEGMVCERPRFAILNPELTYTLPSYQTAAGAIDIMAHVMERYFTPTKDVDFTDMLCEATMKIIIQYTSIAIDSPKDYNARSQMMWASTIAHNRLLETGRLGDWAAHGLQHAMGGLYHMSHGAGLAVIYPAWMKYNYRRDISRFVKYAVRVWDVDYSFGSDEEIALEGIRRYEAFAKSIGMPTTFKELGVPSNRIDEMARTFHRGGVFAVLEESDALEIYKLALG